MAPFIQSVFEQVKDDLAEVLSRKKVEEICHELKHVWRECPLDPVTTPPLLACLASYLEARS